MQVKEEEEIIKGRHGYDQVKYSMTQVLQFWHDL